MHTEPHIFQRLMTLREEYINTTRKDEENWYARSILLGKILCLTKKWLSSLLTVK